MILPALLLAAFQETGVPAQGPPPDLPKQAVQTRKIERATSPAKIDGILDDELWKTAVRIPLDHEWSPGDNVKPPVTTTAFVAFDDGHIYVWKDMLTEIENALGKKAFVRWGVPNFALKAAAMASEATGKLTNKPVMLTRDKVNELLAPHWVCDSTDTRRDLGWEPQVDWREGTRRSVEWYRANQWL